MRRRSKDCCVGGELRVLGAGRLVKIGVSVKGVRFMCGKIDGDRCESEGSWLECEKIERIEV